MVDLIQSLLQFKLHETKIIATFRAVTQNLHTFYLPSSVSLNDITDIGQGYY